MNHRRRKKIKIIIVVEAQNFWPSIIILTETRKVVPIIIILVEAQKVVLSTTDWKLSLVEAQIVVPHIVVLKLILS